MNRAIVTLLALFACACIDGPPGQSGDDAATPDAATTDAATSDAATSDAESRDGGDRPDASTDMSDGRLRVILLLTEDQVDKTQEWKSRIEQGSYDVLVVPWLDFKTVEQQRGDVIVVPPDGGAQLQEVSGELVDRPTPVVWMTANWAPNLRLSATDALQRVPATQDVVLFDHPVIDIAGIDDGSPDYEIYLSEQEVPCYASIPTDAQPVANVADAEECESFIHVYDAGVGSGPLSEGPPFAARRVLLPLESPLDEWTAVADELLYASIAWAGR